jgi:hypothetical protein
MRLCQLGCLLLGYILPESSCMCQCCILTCESIALVGLDGDHAHGGKHLHCGIGSVDDHHKFQEERSLEDAFVPDVKAGHLKHQHLLTLVVSCSTRHL